MSQNKTRTGNYKETPGNQTRQCFPSATQRRALFKNAEVRRIAGGVENDNAKKSKAAGNIQICHAKFVQSQRTRFSVNLRVVVRHPVRSQPPQSSCLYATRQETGHTAPS